MAATSRDRSRGRPAARSRRPLRAPLIVSVEALANVTAFSEGIWIHDLASLTSLSGLPPTRIVCDLAAGSPAPRHDVREPMPIRTFPPGAR